MTFTEWCARLDVKRGMATCPAHEDRTPSLSVTEGRDGATLLRCHAGCSVEAILAPLGLEKRDLFADEGRRDREIVATYRYTDETGALLFEVCRTIPKGFFQRRPDGTPRLTGVRRVLYRLPELRAAVAAGKRVFVCEGEKDCDAVRATGHTATTNPGGAGKWRDSYSAELRGADAVIVADKDAPGRAHAQQVAKALAGIAAKVVIVEAADGKDVSDHLAAGRKLADLVPITLAEPCANGSDPLATSGVAALKPGAALADVALALRKLVPLLPSDALDRRVLRGRTLAALKEATVTDAAGLVDAAWPRGTADSAAPQGQAVTVVDPAPWPEPVEDGAALLEEVRAFIARYWRGPDGADRVLAVFVLHTYAADAGESTAYLVLFSPVPQCGKTRGLEVLGLLAWRPWLTTVVSTAVLFRKLQHHRPTLLLDEAEVVRGRGEAADNVRAILHAGNRRGAAVDRCVGDAFELRQFHVFGPKVFAVIGTLPPALFDRCIAIEMQRARKSDAVDKLRRRTAEPAAATLRQKLRRWAADHRDELAALEPVVPEFLDARAGDTWEPLLAIGHLAGGGWYDALVEAARALTGARDDEGERTELLADLRAVWSASARDRMPSTELADALNALEGHPWADKHHGNGLTANALARLLKAFSVEPKQLGGDKNPRGYARDQFADAFARYLPPAQPLQPLHPSNGAENPTPGNRYAPPPLAVDDSGENPRDDRTIAVAAVAGGDTPEREGDGPGLWDVAPPDECPDDDAEGVDADPEADARAALEAGA